MTDPIADYLTRLRNAISAKHRVVEVPASNLKKEITKILFDKGYILNYKFVEDGPQGTIKVALKYDAVNKVNAIKKLERVSTPGMRKYTGYKDMPRVINGLGIAIISTSKGVMTDKEAAALPRGGAGRGAGAAGGDAAAVAADLAPVRVGRPEQQRLELPEHAVRAPLLRELDSGALQVAIIRLELALEFLEEREGIRHGASEPREDLVVIERAHLARVRLHDRMLAERDLPVAGDGRLAILAHGDDGRRVKLRVHDAVTPLILHEMSLCQRAPAPRGAAFFLSFSGCAGEAAAAGRSSRSSAGNDPPRPS